MAQIRPKEAAQIIGLLGHRRPIESAKSGDRLERGFAPLEKLIVRKHQHVQPDGIGEGGKRVVRPHRDSLFEWYVISALQRARNIKRIAQSKEHLRANMKLVESLAIGGNEQSGAGIFESPPGLGADF